MSRRPPLPSNQQIDQALMQARNGRALGFRGPRHLAPAGGDFNRGAGTIERGTGNGPGGRDLSLEHLQIQLVNGYMGLKTQYLLDADGTGLLDGQVYVPGEGAGAATEGSTGLFLGDDMGVNHGMARAQYNKFCFFFATNPAVLASIQISTELEATLRGMTISRYRKTPFGDSERNRIPLSSLILPGTYNKNVCSTDALAGEMDGHSHLKLILPPCAQGKSELITLDLYFQRVAESRASL